MDELTAVHLPSCLFCRRGTRVLLVPLQGDVTMLEYEEGLKCPGLSVYFGSEGSRRP